jgi:hypothetical protein
VVPHKKTASGGSRFASPEKWLVILHHIPYRHIQALWNGEMLEIGYSGTVYRSEKV